MFCIIKSSPMKEKRLRAGNHAARLLQALRLAWPRIPNSLEQKIKGGPGDHRDPCGFSVVGGVRFECARGAQVRRRLARELQVEKDMIANPDIPVRH
jgi:hypothetical protein